MSFYLLAICSLLIHGRHASTLGPEDLFLVVSHYPVRILLQHAVRVSLGLDLAVVEPDSPVAHIAHLAQAVTYQHNGNPFAPKFVDLVQAAKLKGLVAHGQDFVHQEDIGTDMNRDRKAQPHVHA